MPSIPATIAQLDVEPGELPETMAAWVIREEREGEPIDAFQLEEIEVPRARRVRGDRPRDGRGRELQQRLGGAGQAGLGLPLPRTRTTTSAAPTRPASSGRSARASRAGSPATRSSSTATRPPTRTPRSTASTRWPRRRSRSGATRRPGARSPSSARSRPSSCCPSRKQLTWEEAASYGLTYFTAYRMLIDQAQLQAGHRVLIWGAAGGLGVFATQLCQARRRRRGRRRLLAPRRASWSSSSAPSTTSTATSSRA